MDQPRGEKPYVWVTWIAGLLAGTNQCQWAAWYKAHFKYQKRLDGQREGRLASWSADHDTLVRNVAEQLEQQGWQVKREKQNSFHWHGERAVFAGQPDLVAQKDGQPLRILDGKTGDPSKKDWWQVLCYMVALPAVWKRPGLWLQGELVYGKQKDCVVIVPADLTPDRVTEIYRTIRLVGNSIEPIEPKPTPSRSECAFCDIAACPVRWKEPTLEVLTHEF